MLTTTKRAYTEAELDTYSEQMGSSKLSLAMIVGLGVGVGGLSALSALGVRWVYALITSGAATWTFPLIVGGAVALLTIVGLWYSNSDDGAWTEQPPKLATDVMATADAAWDIESDSIYNTLVLRVEPDRYLLVGEKSWKPQLPDEDVPATIPANIRLVLMGEEKFAIAMDVSLSGPTIPLAQVPAMPEAEDPDGDDETPMADGLYMYTELPASIRKAIGAA